MKHSMHTLKALRDIAFDLGVGKHPDLAAMARELGRVVHRDGAALNEGLKELRTRERGFERWLLATRGKPGVSILVMAWPANHATPVHDHLADEAQIAEGTFTPRWVLEDPDYAKDLI